MLIPMFICTILLLVLSAICVDLKHNSIAVFLFGLFLMMLMILSGGVR